VTDIIITTYVTFFVIMDPIGLTPIFAALTVGMDTAKRRAISLRASLIAFSIMLLFGIAGEAVLSFVGISLPAFRIAGGLLLFLIAVEMLFKRRNARRSQEVEHDHDPSVFPLAVPLIAGPGAIATMILLAGANSGDFAAQAMVIATMGAAVLTTLLFFQLGGVIERLLGSTGIDVVTRLLGMLLAALAVQFVLDGLRDVGLIGA
jgi:MarC family membrane protein